MNTENILNPKCSCCDCYWKPDDTDMKTSGLPYKTCKKYIDVILCTCGRYIAKHSKASHLKRNIHKSIIIINKLKSDKQN